MASTDTWEEWEAKLDNSPNGKRNAGFTNLITELANAKVIFQQRAIMAAMDVRPEQIEDSTNTSENKGESA